MEIDGETPRKVKSEPAGKENLTPSHSRRNVATGTPGIKSAMKKRFTPVEPPTDAPLWAQIRNRLTQQMNALAV